MEQSVSIALPTHDEERVGFPIYIGWDRDETEVFDVCQASILKFASIPVAIYPLSSGMMGYQRACRIFGNQRIDCIDELPFSTEFAFARFMVPTLKNEGWALFADCDFLFRADVKELLDLADSQYAVMVVKHRHIPRETQKMDGLVQSRYERKNWSSLILWNCGHPSNRYLTLQDVNQKPGWWLHGFHWLKDEEIGELPIEWNYLVGYYPENPKALHYTLGGPWFEDGARGPFAKEWLNAQRRLKE